MSLTLPRVPNGLRISRHPCKDQINKPRKVIFKKRTILIDPPWAFGSMHVLGGY